MAKEVKDYTERAFVSRSADRQNLWKFIGNVEFRISPRGVGKDIRVLSKTPEEDEILFPPGTKFTVVAVEENTILNFDYIIYLWPEE